MYLQKESCDYFTISLGRDASHSVKVTTLYVCKDVMNESYDDICDCAQNHRARTADGKCKAEDARTTNFNAYASVHGNYAQHFGRKTALRCPLVNMSISIMSSTLLEGRNFRKQLFQENIRKFN